MTRKQLQDYLGQRPNLRQWLIISAVFGLFLIVIGYDLAYEYMETRESAERRLLNDARIIQDNLSVQLDNASTVVSDLIDDATLWSGDISRQTAINRQLSNLGKVLPGVGSLSLLDANGMVTASSAPELVNRNLSKRHYFQLAREQFNPELLYVSEPLLSVTGRRVILLVKSRLGPGGKFQGVVAAALDLSYFETLLKSVLHAPDMWSAVIHGDGELFTLNAQSTRPDHEKPLIAGLLPLHLQHGMSFSLQEGVNPNDHTRHIVAFQTVSPPHLNMDKPLIVAVSRDLAHVLADWRMLSLILGLGTLAVLAAAIGLQISYQKTQRNYEDEARQQRLAREAAEKQFVVAFYEAPIGMLLKDAEGRVLQTNAAITEMLGYSQEAIMRLGLPALMKAADQQHELAMLQELMSGQRHDYRVELPLLHKDGHEVWVLLSVSGVFNEQGQLEYLIKHLQDITVQHQQAIDLQKLAHYDTLTKLPNRALLEDRLGQSIASAARRGGMLAVCFVDLDRFKSINDQYGHEAGDEVLIASGTHMQQQLRTGDTLARLGGDEFVALLSHINAPHEADEVIKRLRSAIEEPIRLSCGETVTISASFGICFYPNDGDSAEALLRQSDRAMYAAKFSGKGHVRFAEGSSITGPR